MKATIIIFLIALLCCSCAFTLKGWRTGNTYEGYIDKNGAGVKISFPWGGELEETTKASEDGV